LIATAEQPLATSIVAKIDGVPSSQSLDIAFHGRVNFDLRPNTDIEISLPFAATNWQPSATPSMDCTTTKQRIGGTMIDARCLEGKASE
jgi:hypothetical protein